MESQLTLRLPADLARALARRAKARGVPRSQLVREAVARYVRDPEPLSDAEFQERALGFIGSLQLDPAAARRNPVARRLTEQNFRE